MAANHPTRVLSAGDDDCQHVVAFIGLGEEIETLLLDVIPGVRVLSFPAPSPSKQGIEAGARNLLQGLHEDPPISEKSPEITIFSHGIAGFMVKQAMIHVNSHKKYTELSSIITDLIFLGTPHRVENDSSWATVLRKIPRLDAQKLEDGLSNCVDLISSSFLSIARRYHMTNLLEPQSSLKIDGFDTRIFGYRFEKNIEFEKFLTAPELRGKINDQECLHQCLTPARFTVYENVDEQRYYLRILEGLSWSWRPMDGHGTLKEEKSMLRHLLEEKLGGSSAQSIQLIGPTGCAKRTLMNDLIFIEDRKPQNTVLILSRREFKSQDNLSVYVLKAFAHQILWQKPFLLSRLQPHLPNLVDDFDYGWTESSLWILIRLLCQGDWTDELVLFISDISSWSQTLRPLLQFIQTSSKIQHRIISTNIEPDLSQLPDSTFIFNVADPEIWKSRSSHIIQEAISNKPVFDHPDILEKVHGLLQPLLGDCLTATLYLELVSRLTVIPTPAAIEHSLNKFPVNREMIYHHALTSITARGPEVSRLCSQALSWMLHASHPLNKKELKAALAISQAEPKSSKQEVMKHMTAKMWQFLDQHIGLFLRVDNRTMLFVHDTAKHSILKYSEETAEDGFSIFSHTMLATLCVRHLCTFLPEYQPHMEKLHKGDAFIPYAAKQWARHYHLGIQDAVSDEADDASTELESLIEEFISSQDQRDSWYAIVHPELTEFDKSGDIPTKLEMASELGLARIVGEAIKNRDNDEIDDKVLERSLRLATKYGHGNIVNLITQTEVSVSSALPFSTEQDKVQILQHFLEIDRKKSFHFATTDISAALESAAQNGHLEAVRLILAHTKGIQEYEVVHDLPLEEAADRGHMEILDYLLQYVKELPETEKADQEPPAQEERISDEDQKIEDKEDDLEVKDSGQQAAAGEPQSEDVVESKSEPEDEESVSENEKPSIEDMKKGALYRACRRGNEEMVRLLLQHGIKPTHKAINITAEAGYSDIMKLILEALDPQNADDVKLNETFALSKAAENGHLAVVKLLLDNNVSIDGLSPEEDTPLHRAAANGYVEVCRLLISQGANPNGIKDDKMTPAQLAADGGYLSTFQALQECPDPSNYYNYIRLAAENGHVLMVRYLLGLDQELDPKNNELESALATVASKGYLAVTRELCKAGVEVNRRTGNHSAIHNAAGKGHVQLVEYLLTQGADVNACGDLRRTPLHEAVKYPEILAMLLDHGAHVDVTDLDDRTPLHAAIGAKEETSTEDDLERSVRMLIEANADVDAKDEDGNTPLHLAARVSFEAAVDALLERSAKATGANEDKNTVLHLAAKFSSPAIMKSLLGASTGGCDSTNEESKTPLNIAAARGENTIVLLLVEETSDKAINTADEDGKTPLHYVARNSDGEALKALVAAGADINAKDASQATALINAATRGDLETAKLLLECGADMEIIDKNNDTALLASIPENYVDIARLLLEKGANVSAVETYGNAPLLLAALDGHKDMVQLLLESGANIDQANDDKWTPLAAAITNDHADIASILVDHGANIEAMNTFGSTPLHLAAIGGNMEIIRLLLEKGADMEAASTDQWTPLASAVSKGHLEISKLLIGHGANIEVENSLKWRPLNLAASNGHFDIAKMLMEKGADLEAPNKDKWTPLPTAANKGHTEIVKLLVEKGANIEAANIHKWRSLNLAASSGFIDIVKFLLGHDADVEAANQDKWTPVASAALNGHSEVVTALLDQDANIEAKNKYGSSPLSLAASNGHLETVKLLVDRGADVESCDTDGFTPLIVAASDGHLEVCQYLLDKNVKVNVTGRANESALYRAIRYKHLNVIRLLLKYRADPDICTDHGFSPLHESIHSNYVDGAAVLIEHGASIDCRDMLGKTPRDWLILHDADKFYERIPSLKQMSPTNESDWKKATRESIVRILGKIDVPDSNKNHLLWQVCLCLSQLGDISISNKCMLQRAELDADTKKFKFVGFCDLCEEPFYDVVWMCRMCPDTSFCENCVEKQKETQKVMWCMGHEYREIRACPPYTDDPPDSEGNLKALLEEIHSVYDKQGDPPA